MHKSYRLIRRQVKGCPYVLAAPSWVWPGSIYENCEKLAGVFPEVGLLFLETRPCLGYGRNELPPELADLPFSYHVHLPLDLDWRSGAKGVFQTVAALAEKISFLAPRAYVLHPPPVPADERRSLLLDLAGHWRESGLDPGVLLLENTEHAGPVELLALAAESGNGLCLDLGHIMAYEHALPPMAELADRVGMLHLSAPGPNAEHLSLLELNGEGVRLMRGLIGSAGRDAVLMLEIFDPESLFESAAWLAGEIEEWKL